MLFKYILFVFAAVSSTVLSAPLASGPKSKDVATSGVNSGTDSKGATAPSSNGGQKDESLEDLIKKCFAKDEQENYEACAKGSVLVMLGELAASSVKNGF